MQNYISNKQSTLDNMESGIKRLTDMNEECYKEVRIAYAAGHITEEEYNRWYQESYIDEYYYIRYFTSQYNELKAKYQPLIDDANTIIDVNK